MPERITERALRAIHEKVFPGCVVGVVRNNGERIIMPFGTLRYAGDERVTEETIYDVASVTKSIPTASLALTYISEGKFALTDLVRTYIPELQNDRAATVKDLLQYRVYGEQMSSLAELTAKEIAQRIYEFGFTDWPGESRYTNLPAFLLGIIVERIMGHSLHSQADELFFKPLDMQRTHFFSQGAENIAPSEMDAGKELCGMVHDESARAFSFEGKTVGHSGLFSTAPDLLNFLQALLIGMHPSVVSGAQTGLGWQLNQGFFMGKRFGPRTFGKTGFTGASVLCDADRGVGLVILSNRTYPTRPPDAMSLSSAINIFRREIADIVL